MTEKKATGLNYLLGRAVSLRGEIAWVAFGQGLVFLGGFASVKALTTLMGPEEYGRLALGLTVAGFLNMFVYGPVGQAVARYFSVFRERGELLLYNRVILNTHKSAALFVIAGGAAVFAAVYVFLDLSWASLVFAAIIFSVVTGWNGTFFWLLSAMRQRKLTAMHQAADAWLRLTMAVAGVTLVKNGAVTVLAGYLAGTSIVCLSQLVFTRRVEAVRENLGPAPWDRVVKARDEFLRYASSFTLFAIPAAINVYSDRWILQGLSGAQEVGVYVAVYQIANAPVALLLGVINQLMIPIIYERAGDMSSKEQERAAHRLLYGLIGIFAVFSLVVTAAAYFFSLPVVRLFTAPAFAEYHYLLWILVAAISLSWIGNLMSIEAEYHKRPMATFWPKCIYSAALVSLGIILGRTMGAAGVAAGLAAASAVYVVSVAVALKIILKRNSGILDK